MSYFVLHFSRYLFLICFFIFCSQNCRDFVCPICLYFFKIEILFFKQIYSYLSDPPDGIFKIIFETCKDNISRCCSHWRAQWTNPKGPHPTPNKTKIQNPTTTLLNPNSPTGDSHIRIPANRNENVIDNPPPKRDLLTNTNSIYNCKIYFPQKWRCHLRISWKFYKTYYKDKIITHFFNKAFSFFVLFLFSI